MPFKKPIANSVNVAVSGGGVTDTMTWNASSNASQPARFLRLNLTGFWWWYRKLGCSYA